MHTDIRALDSNTRLHADLCIVGAGAAGIAIALEWAGSSRSVLLLEGGGLDLDSEIQDLYRGSILGQPYYPLESASLHYLGGATGHWAGFCTTLDRIDFERRDWVPESGWPIARSDLDVYYNRAHRYLELGPYEYDVKHWEEADVEQQRLPVDPRVAWTKIWQFSPPTRFGTKYYDELVRAQNIHLLTYANVCDITANAALDRVTGVEVRTHAGKSFWIQAEDIVLACGAMQNARLLLAADRQMPGGLGNKHDLVGRYFMEHIEMPAAELILRDPLATKMKLYKRYPGITKVRGELAVSEDVQRERKILNGTASFQPGIKGGSGKSTFQMYPPAYIEKYRANTRTVVAPPTIDERRRVPASYPVYHLMTRQEQAPNPHSRVILSTERDSLGLRRADLDWRLSPLDKHSMRTFFELLGTEFRRSGVGSMELRDWLRADDSNWPTFLSGGWHQMGTTRMHSDPCHGVVDADCRVHGMSNLFVAGASVFPTGGAGNPIMTVVALALRLSDLLKGRTRR